MKYILLALALLSSGCTTLTVAHTSQKYGTIAVTVR